MTFIEEVDIGSNLLNTTQAMIDLSLSFEWEFDYAAFKTILQARPCSFILILSRFNFDFSLFISSQNYDEILIKWVSKKYG